MDRAGIALLSADSGMMKVSRRDLALTIGRGGFGAATAVATMATAGALLDGGQIETI